MTAPGFRPEKTRKTLFEAVLDAGKKFGRSKIAVEDHERQPLTYGRLVLGSLVLGKAMARETRSGEAVGVLLPNVQALPVTLLGLHAFGRVPALLNFTAGTSSLRGACQIASLGTIVTSRRFVERGKLDDTIAAIGEGRRILYLEDIRARLTSFSNLRGLIDTLFARRVHRRHGMSPDDPAAILFTAGSEGLPKAVVLSSRNLVANAQQIAAHAATALGPSDIFFNPLPMFHSFGLTAGFLTPLLNGMKCVLYPSPLHYRQVPKLVRGTDATILLATDTFLQGYARAADEGDLASLRYVIAGAERVKDETRRLWGRTGTTILEGYGATECSPVIACNLPDRHRPGTVGPFLPGIEWRLEPVEGIHEGGRLSVRGPNVMLGYLDPADPGCLIPPPDGWHDTGDIVTVDDGFVTIRGRAKRFAKIGGEMVSLAAVEAMVQRLWPDANHLAVVLPDSRKGEQIVLVTEKATADRAALMAYAQAEGFPELWIPRSILVAGIPVLGSGKADYAAASEMVRKLRGML